LLFSCVYGAGLIKGCTSETSDIRQELKAESGKQSAEPLNTHSVFEEGGSRGVPGDLGAPVGLAMKIKRDHSIN